MNLVKEIFQMSNYGRDEFQFREEVKGELGDVLYSLITVANSLDVDLEEELEKVLEKYKKRMEKGSPDSEND
jgi:NTP pyrophosphatase (non-canonical NTP hydrolase)